MERTTTFMCIDFYLFLYDPDVDHILCNSSTEEYYDDSVVVRSCLRYLRVKIPPKVP